MSIVNPEMLDKLIVAIAKVSSKNNPNFRSPDGTGVGLLAINRHIINHVNDIFDTDYTLEQCLIPVKSKTIAMHYLQYAGYVHWRKTNYTPTLMNLVMSWIHFGYNGIGAEKWSMDGKSKATLKRDLIDDILANLPADRENCLG